MKPIRVDRASALETVLMIARRAADVELEIYAGAFDVEYKGVNDPVTVADKKANALICEALIAAFPGMPIVAEESDPSTFAGFESAEAAWFVDPLDGTRDFVARNGEFAVMIGLAELGVATLGVVVLPSQNRAFIGAEGLGAFEVRADGSRFPIATSAISSMERANFVVSRSRRTPAFDERMSTLGVGTVTPCGSAGVKGVRVACAEADVYLHVGRAGKLWDSCAPEAIVRAAGGIVTDNRGERIQYRAAALQNEHGIVMSNPLLHARVIAATRVS